MGAERELVLTCGLIALLVGIGGLSLLSVVTGFAFWVTAVFVLRRMSCGLALLLVLATVSPGNTLVVYCTNCSEMFTQALERVTNLSQLETLVSQYQEAVTQTIEQIEMVANQVKQYQNMDGLFDRVLLIVGVGSDQEKIEITREKS